MNVHKNARLTFARRIEMVQEMTERPNLSPKGTRTEQRH